MEPMRTESVCRWHEVLSIGLLGLGTMFLYLGWFMQCFVSESVINAVHGREPNRIDANAGYYGTKLMLSMSALFFSIYYIGFFHIHSYQYYASLLFTAFAYAFYNQGEGAYISEHSSRRTIEVNTIIETSVGHSRYETIICPKRLRSFKVNRRYLKCRYPSKY
ncbi:unnamed protein product [Heligmosomoides polygyrus]|uniref:DUF1211 domain-containing protein n=1 Tax=Heligmosomoides polygyrus TaxID=6339 RepID=A0A3P8CFX6_HELPZ|nr:unnamed protein product [Heligmosomoides polygyrus]